MQDVCLAVEAAPFRLAFETCLRQQASVLPKELTLAPPPKKRVVTIVAKFCDTAEGMRKMMKMM